jgi:glycosyltransferase involved in cell wall biosynthesis
MNIIYLGYNSFKKFKRGVENVILFQSISYPFDNTYYIHWDNNTTAYRFNHLVCISIKKNIFWPITLNYLIFKLRKRSKVILHSHNPLMTFFTLKNTDFLSVHDALYYQNKANKKHLILCQLFKFIEMIVYKRCKQIHFISEFTKSKSFIGYKESKIIYNTTNYEKIITIPVKNNCKTKKTVLIVRSIERRARFDLIIKLAERFDNINFTVAGKGPLLDFYQNLILNKNIKNITFKGYVPDKELAELYQTSDVILMIANDSEGFGLPIIEGYFFNKPVIASNVCAIPEIIISHNFLFENNLDDISRVINTLDLINNYDYKTYYDNKFSSKIILPQYFELYTSLITS